MRQPGRAPAPPGRTVGAWASGLLAFKAECAIALVTVVLLAFVWIRAELTVDLVRADGEAAGVVMAQNLAQLLVPRWTELAGRVTALNQLARIITRGRVSVGPATAELLGELRFAMALAGPAVARVGATDALGVALWSTAGDFELTERAVIRQAMLGGQDHFVGRPARDPVTGQWSIQFAEAMRSPDHTLVAITVVTVDAAIARTWTAGIDVGRDAVVTIVREDGVVLARSDGAMIGETMPATAVTFQAALINGSAASFSDSPIDGVGRFIAVRQVQGTPVLILAGLEADLDRQAVHAVALRLWQSSGMLTVALLALAAASVLLARRQRSLTRERRSGEDLAQREGLLRQIAEQATDLICLLDAGMRFIYVSRAALDMLGHDPRQMIGTRFGSQVLAAERPAFQARIDQLIRDGGSQRLTGPVHHHDGGVRWLEVELVAVTPSPATLPGDCHAIAIMRDVTKRHLDEEALRATTEQFEALLRLGPGLLYRVTFDAEGGRAVEYPSEAMAVAADPTSGSPSDPHFGPHFGPRDRVTSAMRPLRAAAADAAIERCRQTGTAVAEYQLPRPDGPDVWIRNEMRVARPGGTAIIGYLTDITAEHEARLRLKLTERLLTLGEVAQGIAHEINQPLAAISLAAENGLRVLKRGGGEPAVLMRKLERIAGQAHRLGKVVRHIQTVGRADQIPNSEFTAVDLIGDALMLCEARLRASNVTVTLDLEPDLPRLRARRVLLEQVLMNIVVNACDAYDDAGDPARAPGRDPGRDAARRELHVTAEADGPGPGAFMVFNLADQAGGIAPAVLPRIFDPFFTTKQPGKGVGLGLSISFSAVREMGGDLSARNLPGGAVFTIRLPLAGVDNLPDLPDLPHLPDLPDLPHLPEDRA
jgi:PAS domain S-box-containing protein